MADYQTPVTDDPRRARAVRRLKKKRDFWAHLLVYVLMNSFVVVVWLMTGANSFFWPIFVMVPWGIGVVMNAWDVWQPADFDEDQIQREVTRIRQR